MARAREHRLGRPGLDDPARVHHRDPIAELGHHAEVVGDEHEREAALAPQLVEERQHLGLHRDVERGGRLVGDDQIGIVHQGQRDADPLAHAAGQLVREGPCARRRVRNAHLVEQRYRVVPGFAPRHPAVGAHRLHHLVPDGVERMERGQRVLEDAGGSIPAHATKLLAGHGQRVAAAQTNRARGDDSRGRGHEPEHGQRRHRLAGAGLADDPETLARRHREADPADRPVDARTDLELGAQTLDFEERAGRFRLGDIRSFHPGRGGGPRERARERRGRRSRGSSSRRWWTSRSR